MPDTDANGGEQGENSDDTMLQDSTDLKFAEMAVNKGLVTNDQMEVAMQAHRTVLGLGLKRSLSEIMVEKGLMTAVQAEGVRRTVESGGDVKIVGGFELLDKLGEGGMGVVYKAKQLSLEREVALKILPERLNKDREFVARFEREAKVAAKLDHVNIVRALDVGEAQGLHYFAMEFVEGENLGEILDRDGKMTEDKAIDIMLQSSRALQHAHEHSLIHRDIKPDNILVTKTGVAKVADLGLARSTDENSTRMTVTGTAMGTPHYISPEQARGEADVDIRTDIYSLGVTFYHMLTGHPPFQGSTAAVVITRRLTEDPPWIRDVLPNISEGTAMVVRKMMARDRNDRYKDPADLIHDMELIADNKLPEIAKGAPGQSSSSTALPAATAQPPAPGSETRGTGVVPVVTPPTGPNPALLIGSIVGGAVVVVGIVLAIVFSSGGDDNGTSSGGGQQQVSAGEVFKIISEIKKLEREGDLEGAISTAETAKSSFEGTPDAPKFATVLADLKRKQEREVMAKDQFELIKRLADSGNASEALSQARKAEGKYDGTKMEDQLKTQLAELKARAEETEKARSKLRVVLGIVKDLEKDGTYEKALQVAKRDYEELKDVEGADELTQVIERLENRVGAKEDAAAIQDAKLIRDLAAGGAYGQALAKAIEAVDKYAGTRQANTFAKLRDEIRAQMQKAQADSAKTKELNALMKEASDAMGGKRYAAAVAAYEKALKVKSSPETKKLLADAKYANHMDVASSKEKAGDLAGALEEVIKAAGVKDTAEARSRSKDLERRIGLTKAVASAEKLELAGKLAEAKDAYAAALKVATPAEQKDITTALSRVSAAMLDAGATAELAQVETLIGKKDYKNAIERASAGLKKYPAKRAEFVALRDEAQGQLTRGELSKRAKAKRDALLKRAADAVNARKYDDAIAAYEDALKIEASGKTRDLLADARYQKHLSASMAKEREGKLADALQQVDAAIAAKSTPLAAQRRKELERRIALGKAMEAARALARKGQTDEAIDAMTKSMEGASDSERKSIASEIARLESGKAPEPAQPTAKTITSRTGMKLALVPGGVYTLGQAGGQADEKPVRKVTLNPFYIGVYEVTNAQFRRFNPRHETSQYSKGPNCPAVGITWSQANDYCAWLSRAERATYRLPTEAEWEAAARGTDERIYPWGNNASTRLLNWGNPKNKAASRADGHLFAAPVGSYPKGASPFGCLDMAGNVWEWCMDWYAADAYAKGTATNPRGPRGGKEKVLRGGSWYHSATLARSANRHKLDPRSRQPSVGFRVVMEPGK